LFDNGKKYLENDEFVKLFARSDERERERDVPRKKHTQLVCEQLQLPSQDMTTKNHLGCS